MGDIPVTATCWSRLRASSIVTVCEANASALQYIYCVECDITHKARAESMEQKAAIPRPAMVFSPMTRYLSYSAAPYRLPTVPSTLEVQYRELLDLRERVRNAEIAAARRPRIEAFMSGAKVERGDIDPAGLGR